MTEVINDALTDIAVRGRTAPMMAAARFVASDATMELSAAALQAMALRLPSTGDPVDDLVARTRLRTDQAVDALQVAALLEADGVNDRAARVEYGYTDVFALADDVFRRLGGSVPRLRSTRNENPEPGRWLRDLSHGLLYLLPSALFPAVLAVVQPHPFVVALIVAGLLGWVWAGGATWLAYQWLNVHDPKGAGRVLVWTSLAGVLVAAGVGAGITVATHSGATAAVLVPAVMTYQMAATVLLFYRRELWVTALMVPSAVAGVFYVVIGPPALRWALGTITFCVALAFVLSLVEAGRAGRRAEAKRAHGVLRGRSATFLTVLAYNLLTALFLLHAQMPYLLTHLDIVVAGAPLIVAMGVVEWRARRFGERSRWLLSQVRYPRQFSRRIWLMLAGNATACSAAVALLAAPLLLVLWRFDKLTPAGVAMAAAQVALAGAYFLAFVLAGHHRYGWLSVALGTSVAAHVVAGYLVSGQFTVAAVWLPRLSAYTDMVLFFGSAVLLQVLLLVALAPILGQARRYR
jgi:hypothetical protein